MKVKEENEKVGLKLNIQKTKIMASGPITSWQIDGETVSDFILGGSKITADGDSIHEIKRCLLFRRKAMINLDSILKSRDITLPTKVHSVKGMIFPDSHVWMWELVYKESWAPKNWCFWTVVLETTPESWTANRSSQSILKKISPEYSLESLMLKLKLQQFGYLMQRTDSSEKTLSLSQLRELVTDRVAWHAVVHGVAKSQTWLSNWTELDISIYNLEDIKREVRRRKMNMTSRWIK